MARQRIETVEKCNNSTFWRRRGRRGIRMAGDGGKQRGGGAPKAHHLRAEIKRERLYRSLTV
jgi:hypothetical protein